MLLQNIKVKPEVAGHMARTFLFAHCTANVLHSRDKGKTVILEYIILFTSSFYKRTNHSNLFSAELQMRHLFQPNIVHFLFSPWKHMLWIPIRSASTRRFKCVRHYRLLWRNKKKYYVHIHCYLKLCSETKFMLLLVYKVRKVFHKKACKNITKKRARTLSLILTFKF